MQENKSILYIACGIPGSGKTTFLNSHKAKNEIVISRDDIRYSLLKEGEDYFSREEESYNLFIKKITEAINKGFNVYADATHLTKRSRDYLLYNLTMSKCLPSKIEAIYFDIPIDICLQRNEKRKGTKTYVPEKDIRSMYKTLTAPDEFSKVWRVDKNNEVSKYIGG